MDERLRSSNRQEGTYLKLEPLKIPPATDAFDSEATDVGILDSEIPRFREAAASLSGDYERGCWSHRPVDGPSGIPREREEGRGGKGPLWCYGSLVDRKKNGCRGF